MKLESLVSEFGYVRTRPEIIVFEYYYVRTIILGTDLLIEDYLRAGLSAAGPHVREEGWVLAVLCLLSCLAGFAGFRLFDLFSC